MPSLPHKKIKFSRNLYFILEIKIWYNYYKVMHTRQIDKERSSTDRIKRPEKKSTNCIESAIYRHDSAIRSWRWGEDYEVTTTWSSGTQLRVLCLRMN